MGKPKEDYMDKKRILVIDDEAGFTRMLQLNLEQTNRYEVCVVNWPEDAFRAACKFKPDLVLLDILMPEMVGGDVLAAFEADPVLKETPVVFLTAAVQKHQVEEHAGFICDHPCLAKPASLEQIVACIESNWVKRRDTSPFRLNMLPRDPGYEK